MLTEVKKNTVKNILKKITASIISQITSGVIPLSGSNANFDELSWHLLEVGRSTRIVLSTGLHPPCCGSKQ